jgi:hypothetical protein
MLRARQEVLYPLHLYSKRKSFSLISPGSPPVRGHMIAQVGVAPSNPIGFVCGLRDGMSVESKGEETKSRIFGIGACRELACGFIHAKTDGNV